MNNLEMDKEVQSFWYTFLAETNLPQNTPRYAIFAFGADSAQADELLRLVRSGVKTATSSAAFGYEMDGSPYPSPGVLSVVLDGAGHPACIIETQTVHRLPFKEVTFDLCSKEGEDKNLESWQKKHRAFFSGVAQELGRKFLEEDKVIVEEFKVIYP